MRKSIGIRKETKDKTQRRVPLSPSQVEQLVRSHGLKVYVEPWNQRIFPDHEYEKAGAILTEDLGQSNIIFGVKEIASRYIEKELVYCFFSHTVKGQAYNMPMLKTILDTRSSLFDYELVKNSEGKRLIYFGDYAGYAGMIDSMWALGQRLEWEGIRNPFSEIKYATAYERLAHAEEAFLEAGRKIVGEGLPGEMVPFICGFTGYGNVSKSAQRLFDLFPTVSLEPESLDAFYRARNFSNRVLYKVQLKKHHIYRHKVQDISFDLNRLQSEPENFVSRCVDFVVYFTMLVNGIYWEPRFPRIITKKCVRSIFGGSIQPRLRVIGDITCDVDGSIELTQKVTTSENPVYVYEPERDDIRDGVEGSGPVILAVDKLPTEMPHEASVSFGQMLLPFVPVLADADYQGSRSDLTLPEEWKPALIAHRGELTPAFTYLKTYLEKTG